jgi:4-hydroxy-tetrahydrodipicolinate synthase
VGCTVTGSTVLGSSGESGYLSPAQRREALSAFSDAAGGHGLQLIVGVTDPATSGAVDLVRSDAAATANAFLVLPPTYYPATLDATERHLRAIADAASGRPVVLYDIPGLTGLSLRPADVRELILRVPAIQGVKLASLDLDGIGDLAADQSVSLFAGYDEIATNWLQRMSRRHGALRHALPGGSSRWYNALADGDRRPRLPFHRGDLAAIRAMVGRTWTSSRS